MSRITKIHWAGATWSPMRGCTEISPGCRNCYAKRMAARGLPGHRSPTTDEPFAIMRNGQSQWTGELELIDSQLDIPLHWRKPRVIFVNSISDTFHEKLWFGLIDRVMAKVALCPQHTFLLLTKRAGRMLRYMRDMTTEDAIAHHAGGAPFVWPLPNVWLGCTAEDQARANEREPHMAELAERGWNTFVSYETALGPVDWNRWGFLRWLIAGGESGPGARPAHPDWFRVARDFAAERGIPFLFKQHGEWLHESQNNGSIYCGRHPFHVWPDGTNNSYRVGKSASGRLLDGQLHDARPEFGGTR